MKEEPVDPDLMVIDTNMGARNMPIDIDIKQEKDTEGEPPLKIARPEPASSTGSQPIIITPAAATTVSVTGQKFGDWFLEAAMLDAQLMGEVTCPVCEARCESGRQYWSHYLEDHWDRSKINNFLCTGCLAVFGLDHVCSHPADTPWFYICSECGCPKEKLVDLESHVGQCAGGLAQLNMACSRCPLVLSNVNSFWKHYSELHWNKNPGYLSLAVGQKGDNTSTKIHLCLPCGAVVPISMHHVHAKACHLPNPRIRCSNCPKFFDTGRLSLQHFRDFHWSPSHFYQLGCVNCGHLSKVAGKCCPKPKWLPLCSFCGEEFEEHSQLFKKHRKTCLGILAEDGTSKIPRDCRECGETYANPKDLAQHMARHHPREKVLPTCKYCPDEPMFDSGLAVWKHTLSDHRTEAATLHYLCKACGQAHQRLASFFEHQVYDHCALNQPEFLCGECGHSCSTWEELTNHKADHADSVSNVSVKDEPGEDQPMSAPPAASAGTPYNCPESGCNRRFGDMVEYWAHYKHNHWSIDKKLRFLCGSCGKVYESVNKIMEHNINVHQGNSTAHILCPKCGEKFLDSDAMEDHMKLCSGPKVSWPQCDVCKRFVPDTACLLKHMMRFHPTSSMPCHICEKVIVCATIEEHLKEHSTTFDGESIPGAMPSHNGAPVRNLGGRPRKPAKKKQKLYDEDSDEDNADFTYQPTPTKRRTSTTSSRSSLSKKEVNCALCHQGYPNWVKLEAHLQAAHGSVVNPVVRIRRVTWPERKAEIGAGDAHSVDESADAGGEIAMEHETYAGGAEAKESEMPIEDVVFGSGAAEGLMDDKMEEGEETEPLSDVEPNPDTTTA